MSDTLDDGYGGTLARKHQEGRMREGKSELPSSTCSGDAWEHPGVWCCERRHNCKWQGFMLHQGLAWGEIPFPTSTSWRKYHDIECRGKLIQLIPPNSDYATGK